MSLFSNEKECEKDINNLKNSISKEEEEKNRDKKEKEILKKFDELSQNCKLYNDLINKNKKNDEDENKFKLLEKKIEEYYTNEDIIYVNSEETTNLKSDNEIIINIEEKQKLKIINLNEIKLETYRTNHSSDNFEYLKIIFGNNLNYNIISNINDIILKIRKLYKNKSNKNIKDEFKELSNIINENIPSFFCEFSDGSSCDNISDILKKWEQKFKIISKKCKIFYNDLLFLEKEYKENKIKIE